MSGARPRGASQGLHQQALADVVDVTLREMLFDR